jgi:hypothetical protein
MGMGGYICSEAPALIDQDIYLQAVYVSNMSDKKQKQRHRALTARIQGETSRSNEAAASMQRGSASNVATLTWGEKTCQKQNKRLGQSVTLQLRGKLQVAPKSMWRTWTGRSCWVQK